MKPTPGRTKTQSAARREQRAAERERDDAGEPGRERERRIGATQLAAPSTRRWRRAGRFDASR